MSQHVQLYNHGNSVSARACVLVIVFGLGCVLLDALGFGDFMNPDPADQCILLNFILCSH